MAIGIGHVVMAVGVSGIQWRRLSWAWRWRYLRCDRVAVDVSCCCSSSWTLEGVIGARCRRRKEQLFHQASRSTTIGRL